MVVVIIVDCYYGCFVTVLRDPIQLVVVAFSCQWYQFEASADWRNCYSLLIVILIVVIMVVVSYC